MLSIIPLFNFYVCLLQPNDNKTAFEWDAFKIVQQLRACGVLETVRISAAGFPSRWKYEEFIDRYDLLVSLNQLQEDDMLATAQAIVAKWIGDEDKCRYGKTQLFFRAGQVAYLEQIRTDLRKRYIIVVQSLVRRFVYQMRYKKIRNAVQGIQRHARGFLARRKAQVVREEKAAVLIQRHVRGWLQRTKYLRTKSAVVRLQARCRAYLTRITFRQMLDNHKAVVIQKYCRGYLARLRFNQRKKQIVICQAAVRRFLARRRYKNLRMEARTVAGMQKKYLGLENKIISMQQRMDEYRVENRNLKKDLEGVPALQTRVQHLKKLETEMQVVREDINTKANLIVTLEQELVKERDEKMQLLLERDREQKEWQSERNTVNEQLSDLQSKLLVLQATADAAAEEQRVSKFEPASELNEVLQRAVNEKEQAEAENAQLREEVRQLQFQLNNSQSFSSHSHSLSTNTSGQNDEDVGYSSAKNTLELRRDERATHKNNNTATILRLRKLLEEEKRASESLQGRLIRYESLKRPYNQSLGPEDRIRLSDLEVEYEKLAQDYESLRLGIARGVETQVLQDQYAALQEEIKRRREESIQLKTVLAEQSQSMRSLNDNASLLDRFQDYTELLEAFQAQKLVNRQLESELTAITDDHNLAVREYTHHLERLEMEKRQLEEVLNKELETAEDSPAAARLRQEVDHLTSDYVRCQEELVELKRMTQIFADRLRDHGLNDSVKLDDEDHTMAAVNKKPQTYQGIFKYMHEDEGKIIQRLVTDYTPKVAITLPPGLPGFIFLMCVRYTDLMNVDQHVRTLLSNIVREAKKLFTMPNTVETRLVCLVNMLKLYNLLRQYGDIEEFENLNTDAQNRQQLKNFDLTDYRRTILTKIVFFYGVFTIHVQSTIKQLIVPALLEYDETVRGKKTARRSVDAEQNVTDPAALVRRLNELYEKFNYFGLGQTYVVQIFHQIFSYISAVALNNILLRSDLCTWRTGMKITHNTGVIRSWAQKIGLPAAVHSKLDVLVEVSTLLQIRKLDKDTDVKSIVDICKLLSATQILKIIKNYRSDDAQPPITQSFIEALSKALVTEVTLLDRYLRRCSIYFNCFVCFSRTLMTRLYWTRTTRTPSILCTSTANNAWRTLKYPQC